MKSIFKFPLYTAVWLLALCSSAIANAEEESEASGYNISVPKPTLAAVRYGDHERHILDFWRAESDAPTPLVYVIHGGGWRSGSK
jgi:acetyl esterase/lipase